MLHVLVLAMFFYLIFFGAAQLSNAVIYDLDDSEYELMPPLFGLDDYHSCLHKHNSPYCLARWDLYADQPNDLIALIKEYSEFTTKHYNHTYIQRGVCLATTCKNFVNDYNAKGNNSNKYTDISTVLEACINETIWNEYALKAKLAQIYYCDELNEMTTKYDWSDWLFGAILFIMIVINIVGSLYHVFKFKEGFKKGKDFVEDNNGSGYVLCFSIFSNWRSLTSTESKDPRFDRLRGLYGIRALTSFIMPLAHVMWMIGTGFTDNPRDFEKAAENIHYQLIFNGMMLVQIFFTISGFLMVYSLQIYSESIPLTLSTIPRLIIYRFLRLSPMNAMMIAFSATWLRYLGSGPLWNFNVTGVVQDCRRYWWMHILYINNYEPDDKACAVQSWHLATDAQLFLLGLIVHLIIKSVGKVIPLTLLMLLSMMAPALHVWYQDLDALVLLKPEFYRSFSDLTYRYIHVLGHNNLSSFFVGMIAGYLAYYWLQNKVNVFQHKVWRGLTWCVILAVVGMLFTGNMFYSESERSSIIIRMTYAALHRCVIGLITAFCILALVFQVDNTQRRLVEWSGWVVPSRLSYCTFLLHVNIIHVMLGSRTQLGHVSFFYVVINYLGIVMLSYLLAVPCYLMFEAPFTRLSKTFLQKNIDPYTKKTR